MHNLPYHTTQYLFPSLNTNNFAMLLILIPLILSSFHHAIAKLQCPDCGLTKVPYPFSTSPSCGDQVYKLRCATGSLWLDTLNGSTYMLSSINPKAQTMIIRPAALIPNTCLTTDYLSQGVQLNPLLPFNITSSNTILLLNCTDNMLHLQTPINCTSTSICHAYTEYTKSAMPCMKQTLCCNFKTGGSQTAYVVRVHGGGCMAYQSFVNLDADFPVAKWPDPGMEIAWVLPQEPICNSPVDCRALSKSKCMPNPRNVGQKRCYCKAGLRWDPVTGVCNSAIGAVLLLLLSATIAYKCRQHQERKARKNLTKQRQEILNANNGKSAKIFTDKELRKATNNFSKDNLLGTGGFGEVFKGVLEDGTIIAFKRAKPGNIKGVAQVLNEVRILCQVNHRSLVRLLGCCVELEQPLLIYEYVSNGTLFEHLHAFRFHKRNPLTWLRRLTAAHQTADGLAYLHSSAVPPIYHRDVKSSNILLDEKLDAKVSDFGLSRLVEVSESDCSHINTSAQGTLGFLDPEYYINLQLTDRSDIYSFGVVLLELLTSNKAIDFNREEENVNLVVYMKKVMAEERLMDVVDPVLKEGASKVELGTMTALGNLAAACLDDRRQNRPSMKEVAEEIEYIISLVTGDEADI